MADRMPMILGDRMPRGTFSFGAAEPPYAGGLPHGRVGPMIEGEAGAWVLVPVDCPQDNVTYGRRNRLWVPIANIIPDPPFLNHAAGFIRRLAVPTEWIAVTEEAPGNNVLYARENQTWVALPAFIGEAPIDTRAYGRSGGQWVWVCNEAPTNVLATWAYARRDGQWFEAPIELDAGAINNIPYGRVRIGELTAWARAVGEAPLDATLRGRQNGQWVPIAPGLPEAPNDQYAYGRRQLTWVEILEELPELAPADKTYGRSRRLWLEVPRDVTVNTEGLADGNYVRRRAGNAGSWVPAPTPPADAPIDATLYARGGTPITHPAPIWQRIPIQEDALFNGNLYARRNLQWQECPEEAPSIGGPYGRRFHQWVPIAEVLYGPWQVLTFFTPNDWLAGSELRFRNIAGYQIEFIGTLNPANPIAGNGSRAIGQPLNGLDRTTTAQYATVVAMQAGGVRTIAGIRSAPGSGLLTLFGLGPGFDTVPDIHFVLALNTGIPGEDLER